MISFCCARCFFSKEKKHVVSHEDQKKAIQHLFATEQKKANKRLNNAAPYQRVTALQDSDGNLATTQAGLLHVTHEYFAQQAAAPTETTEEASLPGDDVSLDSFQLHAAALTPEAQPFSIQVRMSDLSSFQTLIRNLAHGKVPGPDCIPNEVIKYLPGSLLSCIHLLFMLMYKSGTVPAFCKDSKMSLLFNKPDPLKLQNYRPINLANTLSKLYTGLLASAIMTMQTITTFSMTAKKDSALTEVLTGSCRW